MDMINLEEVFCKAKLLDKKYISLKINITEYPSEEIIIIQNTNFENKLRYYKEIYDYELNHKYVGGIKIIDCTSGNDFKEIELSLE
ncbi:TPA: hypothetical protein ACGFEM_000741 [Clostridioides difficile]|uniref:hypothetical protein n=1 Tax=Clostridioides difficile TaxID=1496 RepID=UPI00038CDCAB|nr:hypothetical protein [Clostridioides difficile]AXU53334.1 hypothetical protein CDIF29637_01572 [Clostridioides difficile]AXU71548.1 hypothetical protein CDIF28668_01614 [Clostridioides difficile]EGT3738044.1 hypothetical protein [Clostridioides difficile]EGT3791264.1 hypothetical protein [Clostridioides difficile]EGT4735952.1 hypothetical protein [Clostridioides difficile]